MKNLIFYSDPGHGWLAVPLQLYKESGITATKYSYYCPKKEIVYLEEDLDAPAFENAMKEKGFTFPTISQYEEKIFIRNLERMPWEERLHN